MTSKLLSIIEEYSWNKIPRYNEYGIISKTSNRVVESIEVEDASSLIETVVNLNVRNEVEAKFLEKLSMKLLETSKHLTI